MIAHAARVRNMRIVGKDGKTGWQLARGTGNHPRLITFGELCRYKTRAHEGGIGPSQWRWSTGIWLGIEPRTSQYVLYDHQQQNIKHARTIMTMPSPSQWSKEKIEQVSVTPWSMHERQVPEMTHREVEPAVETQEK